MHLINLGIVAQVSYLTHGPHIMHFFVIIGFSRQDSEDVCKTGVIQMSSISHQIHHYCYRVIRGIILMSLISEEFSRIVNTCMNWSLLCNI